MLSSVAYKAVLKAEEQRKRHPAVTVIELQDGLGAQPKQICYGRTLKQEAGWWLKIFVDPSVLMSGKVRDIATRC